MKNKMREKFIKLPSLQREVKRPQRVFRSLVNLGNRIAGSHTRVHDKPLEDGSGEHLKGRFGHFVGRDRHFTHSRAGSSESIA